MMHLLIKQNYFNSPSLYNLLPRDYTPYYTKGEAFWEGYYLSWTFDPELQAASIVSYSVDG